MRADLFMVQDMNTPPVRGNRDEKCEDEAERGMSCGREGARLWTSGKRADGAKVAGAAAAASGPMPSSHVVLLTPIYQQPRLLLFAKRKITRFDPLLHRRLRFALGSPFFLSNVPHNTPLDAANLDKTWQQLPPWPQPSRHPCRHPHLHLLPLPQYMKPSRLQCPKS